MATAEVNNGDREVLGAALLRLRQRLECTELRLWSEGAMVQAGMTAAVTRARSWCTRQVQAAVEARVTADSRRGKQKGVKSQNPSPPLIGLPG